MQNYLGLEVFDNNQLLGVSVWVRGQVNFLVSSDPTCDADHLEHNVLFFKYNMATPAGVSLSLQRPCFVQTPWSFLLLPL